MRFIVGGLLFFVVFLVFLVLNFPLQLASNIVPLKSHAISYDRAFGTVWRGGFTNMHIGGEPVGLLSFSNSLEKLARGSLEYGFNFAGEVGDGKGVLSFDLKRQVTASNIMLDINLHAFRHLDEPLRRAPSNLNISISKVVINRAGECVEAQGGLSSDLLIAMGRSWAWDGPKIDGTISCKEEDFYIALKTSSGPDLIQASTLLQNDMNYLVDSTVKTENLSLANALLSYGFKNSADQGIYIYRNYSADVQS